jgi:hypothetical protein
MKRMRDDIGSLRRQRRKLQDRAASAYAEAAALREQIDALQERLTEASNCGDAAHMEHLAIDIQLEELRPLETVALHHSPPSVGMLVKGGPLYSAIQGIAVGVEPRALVGSDVAAPAYRATITALKSVIGRVVRARYTAQVSTETYTAQVPLDADYECLHDERVEALDADGQTWTAVESWELANNYLSRHGPDGNYDVQDRYLAWLNALKDKRTSDRHIETTQFGLCAVASVAEDAWLVYFKSASDDGGEQQ